jgi:hypothetical protein
MYNNFANYCSKIMSHLRLESLFYLTAESKGCTELHRGRHIIKERRQRWREIGEIKKTSVKSKNKES